MIQLIKEFDENGVAIWFLVDRSTGGPRTNSGTHLRGAAEGESERCQLPQKNNNQQRTRPQATPRGPEIHVNLVTTEIRTIHRIQEILNASGKLNGEMRLNKIST